MMQKAMKQLGIKQEEIDAEEVVIKCKDKAIYVLNPQVSRIHMAGQESFQISGKIMEEEISRFSKDDVQTVMEQTDCSEKEAKGALEETGDLAEAILKLKKD